MKNIVKTITSLCAVALIAGCMNMRQLDVPSVASLKPTAWGSDDITALSAFSSVSASMQLNTLVAEALENNLDLEVAYQRLAAVRQQARWANSSRLPSLDVSVSDQNQKALGVESETASAQVSLTWELDVWGRVASQSQQLTATASQQAALYKSAQYSLAAQVAKLWFDTIEAQQQLVLTTARTVNLQNSLDIIEDGFNSGIRQALDVYTARAELANNQAALAQRERNLHTLLRQLTVLLGRAPSLAVDIPSQLPEFAALIPEQLSAALIERRPDLHAAYYAMQAQHNALNVAVTNRLPRFSFTGSSGALSSSLSAVLSGNDTAWSLLGGITAPLFRGGQLVAEQKRQQHLLKAEIARYKQTALRAFQEVEQSLHSEQQLQTQQQAAQQAAEISVLAQEQAFEQYVAGISNINTWLQTQRSAFDRASALLQTQATTLKNRVNLYLALGGNFGSKDSQ